MRCPRPSLHSRRTDRIRKIVPRWAPPTSASGATTSATCSRRLPPAFGEEPGALLGVALMTDADNTASRASGEYGEVWLIGATARRLEFAAGRSIVGHHWHATSSCAACSRPSVMPTILIAFLRCLQYVGDPVTNLLGAGRYARESAINCVPTPARPALPMVVRRLCRQRSEGREFGLVCARPQGRGR